MEPPVQVYPVDKISKTSPQRQPATAQGLQSLLQLQNVHHHNRLNHLSYLSVSFAQIKDWVNANSREGVSSPTLSNFLRRRPQFHLVRKDRKQGTNEIQGFWAMDYEDGSPIEKGTAAPGWVEIPIATDTGI